MKTPNEECQLVLCDHVVANALKNASEIVVDHPSGKVSLSVESLVDNQTVLVMESSSDTIIKRYVYDVMQTYSTIEEKFASLVI